MGNSNRHHVPPSDPVIPPCDTCLACGKKKGEKENTALAKCSGYKMALFCNRKCQKAVWNKEHKMDCSDLKAKSQEHMLPYQVRVIRHPKGAYIENGEDIPQATRPPFMCTRQEKQEIPDGLSSCARDHYHSVVKHLTKEQKEQLYPLACIERWGGPPERHINKYRDDDDEEEATVSLSALLDKKEFKDCKACGSDGEQFFSFCLNRPVNSNMVHHCEFCHRCFYFQPGCLRGCQYCGMGTYKGDGNANRLAGLTGISVQEAARMMREHADDTGEFAVKFAEDARGTTVPPSASFYARGLAAEGYWGW